MSQRNRGTFLFAFSLHFFATTFWGGGGGRIYEVNFRIRKQRTPRTLFSGTIQLFSVILTEVIETSCLSWQFWLLGNNKRLKLRFHNEKSSFVVKFAYFNKFCLAKQCHSNRCCLYHDRPRLRRVSRSCGSGKKPRGFSFFPFLGVNQKPACCHHGWFHCHSSF